MGRAGSALRTRVLRGVVIGAVLATVMPWSARVDAAEATVAPSPTGYYTKTQDPFRTVSGPIGEALCQVPSPDPRTCLNPAQLTGGTPGYPRQDNYIYIAAINGDDDSRGVVGTPLFSIPPGSTITKMRLDFYVENEQTAGTVNFDPDNPELQLCMITEGWAGQDAAPYDSQPDTDCEVRSEPKKIKEEVRSETTDEGVARDVQLVLYSADLMPMGRKWAAGEENNGVMILPTPDAGIIYQTAIRTTGVARDGMALHITYTPGAVPTIAPVPVAPTANAPTFGDDVAPEEPVAEPSFDVTEEPAAPSDGGGEELATGQPVSQVSTPWWTFLAIPLGLGTLFGMGRGVAEPIRAQGSERAGPVSRLMDRGSKHP